MIESLRCCVRETLVIAVKFIDNITNFAIWHETVATGTDVSFTLSRATSHVPSEHTLNTISNSD